MSEEVVELDRVQIEAARRFIAREDWDGAIAHLRALGVSQVTSVAVIVRATGMPLHEVKDRVFRSAVWADRRRPNARAQAELLRILDESQ